MEEQQPTYKYTIICPPHDNEEILLAAHARGIATASFELFNNVLRNTIKYDDNASEEVIEYAEKVQEAYIDLLRYNNVPVEIVLG